MSSSPWSSRRVHAAGSGAHYLPINTPAASSGGSGSESDEDGAGGGGDWSAQRNWNSYTEVERRADVAHAPTGCCRRPGAVLRYILALRELVGGDVISKRGYLEPISVISGTFGESFDRQYGLTADDRRVAKVRADSRSRVSAPKRDTRQLVPEIVVFLSYMTDGPSMLTWLGSIVCFTVAAFAADNSEASTDHIDLDDLCLVLGFAMVAVLLGCTFAAYWSDRSAIHQLPHLTATLRAKATVRVNEVRRSRGSGAVVEYVTPADLVRGDVVELQTKARVPADLIIVEADNLVVAGDPFVDARIASMPGMSSVALAGSRVISGHGAGIVVRPLARSIAADVVSAALLLRRPPFFPETQQSSGERHRGRSKVHRVVWILLYGSVVLGYAAGGAQYFFTGEPGWTLYFVTSTALVVSVVASVSQSASMIWSNSTYQPTLLKIRSEQTKMQRRLGERVE